MKKIGFFGGCFNPPTIAHMEIVKKALQECQLDKIVFVPMGDKYSKSDLISFEHRYNMLNFFVNNIDNIEISDMQKNQKEKMYAIDTFKKIEKAHENSQIFFIMGIDNFIKMQEWKSYNELMKYHYIVFKRENISVEGIKFPNVQFVEFDFAISSTKIRELIKRNKSLKTLLTSDVENYIKENNLYK